MSKICHLFLMLGVWGSGVAMGHAQNIISRNAVIAIVHDTVITYGDVLKLTDPMSEGLENQYFDQPQLLKQRLVEVRTEGLNILIERKLILHDFETAGYNIPESIIDEEIKERVRKRFGDQERLIQTLKALGQTRESFRREWREQIIEEALRSKHVSAEIIISPYKIEAYYATNQEQFRVEDEVKLRSIWLGCGPDEEVERVKGLAMDILAKIGSGRPVAEMADYDQDSKKGAPQWVHRKSLNLGLTDIFFKLKAGEHSGVVGFWKEPGGLCWIYQYNKEGKIVTARRYGEREGKDVFLDEKKGQELEPDKLPIPQGFYLLAVEETRGSHIRPLAEVRDNIERTLVVEERSRIQKRWIDKLKNKIFWRTF
jgi:hypothetical protein